jgi:hypothetical protein
MFINTLTINTFSFHHVYKYSCTYKHDEKEKVSNVTVFINMMKGKGVKSYCIYKHDERKGVKC